MIRSNSVSKRVALLVTLVVCAVIVGVVLVNQQGALSRAGYDEEFDQTAKSVPELISNADEEREQATEYFDATYRTRAAAVAFMAGNDAGYEATDAKMSELANLLDVDNLMVVRRDGRIVARAGETKADFSDARFDALLECLKDGEPSEAVQVDDDEEDWHDRYYAAKVGSDTMVVIEQGYESLTKSIEASGSVSSALGNVTIAQHGYVFAVSVDDHTITYHPDSDLVGTEVSADGMDPSELTDGARFSATLDGEQLYCGVCVVDGTAYVMAVPSSDMSGARNIVVGVVLFAFVAIMSAIVLYDVFVMDQDAREEHDEASYRRIGAFRMNRVIARKTAVLSITGFVLLVVVTYYMQTLFALSSQTVVNNERVSEITSTISTADDRRDELEESYSNRYLVNCRIAAYIVEANPKVEMRAKLSELASDLQIASVWVFDADARMVASSTAVRDYALSDDPDDGSYEFRELLGGKEELVQGLTTNESTGEARQFIGVALHDSDGYASGLVQIGIRPKRLEDAISSVKIDHVLRNVKVGSSGYAMAVKKDDGTVAYHPDSRLVGKKASDIGLGDEQLSNGFSDYVTVDGTRLYASCSELDDYYVFAASPESELMKDRVTLTLDTAAVAFAALLAFFPLLTLERAGDPEAGGEGAATDASGDAATDGRVIDVTLADGRVKRSESAASRWMDTALGWGEKSPEQKLATVIRWFAGLAAFVVFLAVVFRDQLFWKGSVIAYILGGNWDHGLNVFAITAAVMYACVAVTLESVAHWLLHQLSEVLGAQGETVCSLISSLVKYGTMLFMLYWCLGVLGVDTATLLASAGIITLAVSFGAKDLVTDVLCGFFIILEGEFRVGDVIQVSGQTGTVMEIGVRTTKINDGDGNVLLLRNSSISNVINKTKLNSYASVDVILPLSESLPYVENVLKRELPNVRRRVSTILDGPFYKGVVEMNDTTMTIRVVATCKEKQRSALVRSLRREMKLLLARHDVAPFRVVDEHARKDGDKAADRRERRSADRFSEEQEIASKDLGNEEGGSR